MDSTKYGLACNRMNSRAARTKSRSSEASCFSFLPLESVLGSVWEKKTQTLLNINTIDRLSVQGLNTLLWLICSLYYMNKNCVSHSFIPT